MFSLPSSTGRFQINWSDVFNSLRAGLFAALGAFAAGSVGAIQGTITVENLSNPRAILATIVLAGLTAVFDLCRRALTDYAK